VSQMNFLALVQRAYREHGLAGAGPVAVTNQSGRNNDVVNWVLSAYEEIQLLRNDWAWDWAQGTFALVSGDDTYDPAADFGISGGIRDFNRAPRASYAYPTAIGVNARNFLAFLEWSEFRGLQVPVASGNVPTIFTLRPDGDVQYYPRPNTDVTVVHEYTRQPQVLAAADDIPRMPDWSHMAIVWKAVMIGCGKTGNFSRFDTAEEEYSKLETKLLNRQTPRVVIGGPLA
jgi:hypothetical protein